MIKKITAAIITTTLILMGGVFLFAKDVSVTVSEIEAQTAINEYLAVNETGKFGVRFTPQHFLMDFQANNTAKINANMLIDGHGYTGQFEGVFATGINYRVPRLYLDDIRLIEGGFQTDETTQSKLQKIKKATINDIEELRKNDAGYNSRIGLERSSSDYIDDLIIKSTKYVFETIPIFDLRTSGKAGKLVSLSLKDVKFTEDAAIITFSPVTALLRILIIIGIILLLIVKFSLPSILLNLLLRPSS